ncbi:galactokinase [Capsulimonas corticalis]|uniref:Galactokinase n=1 Tax=Capsulimonas corticalis TaxID=2219043 RepID=A0A402D119_9BACT|nr:galactokinase [Capsulimonas corticalis]BDI31757.1 galactokinase [Capsulimonas corticalis]
MTVVSKAREVYAQQFREAPKFGAFAPGRVEIMGNHTDYNGGFVLPAALDKGTAIVGSPTGTDEVILVAADFGRTATFSISDIQRDPQNSWADYVMGVVSLLQQDGVSIGGFQAVIASDVPAGAGLSSSAALEVSTAFFLRQLFPYDREPMEIARLCQRAENEYVGVACGILDQFSSVFGKQDGLLFLDCLSLEHGAVTMGRSDIAVVICDSMAKHALTGGDYNTRRAECMAAAAHFGKELLREVSWEEFVARENELPENQRKRARHVLTEDQRVLAMRDAIQGTDTDPIKRLLIEGHASCRDLFENSTPEIDFLAAAAIEIEGCYGAKLTGGGWGGCTVNLVQVEAVPAFCAQLSERYQTELGKTAQIYPCRASAGAHVLEF